MDTYNMYENIQDAFNFKKFLQNLEKPLTNEMAIIRNVLNKSGNLDNKTYLDCFNPDEERQKILSGYYLDINECLNIFKHCQDENPNPFLCFHENAMDYIKYLKNQQPEASEYVKNDTIDSSDLLNDSHLVMRTLNNIDFNKSLMNLSNTELEKETDTADVDKHDSIIAKNKRGRPRKHKADEILVKKMKNSNTSTPNKQNSAECSVQNFPLSPILPPSSYFEFNPNYKYTKLSDDDSAYLKYLNQQFYDSIFKENRRIIYPIATNDNFKNILYDTSEEIHNNKIINRLLFD